MKRANYSWLNELILPYQHMFPIWRSFSECLFLHQFLSQKLFNRLETSFDIANLEIAYFLFFGIRLLKCTFGAKNMISNGFESRHFHWNVTMLSQSSYTLDSKAFFQLWFKIPPTIKRIQKKSAQSDEPKNVNNIEMVILKKHWFQWTKSICHLLGDFISNLSLMYTMPMTLHSLAVYTLIDFLLFSWKTKSTSSVMSFARRSVMSNTVTNRMECSRFCLSAVSFFFKHHKIALTHS